MAIKFGCQFCKKVYDSVQDVIQCEEECDARRRGVKAEIESVITQLSLMKADKNNLDINNLNTQINKLRRVLEEMEELKM